MEVISCCQNPSQVSGNSVTGAHEKITPETSPEDGKVFYHKRDNTLFGEKMYIGVFLSLTVFKYLPFLCLFLNRRTSDTYVSSAYDSRCL